MSCFIVPLTQAVVTTAYRKRHEDSIENPKASALLHHLPTLEKMLWGGSLMLVVDHVINGELSWQFPFFTALESTEGLQIMLREMLTIGLPMSLILTAAWAIYALVKERRARTVCQ